MSQYTQHDLSNLLAKSRDMVRSEEQIPPAALSKEDQEILKMYIPMHLSEKSAQKMMTMVNEIREGKRPPLNDQDRIELNQQNMEESLLNFLSKLSTAGDDEFESICDMCESIRKSRSPE